MTRTILHEYGLGYHVNDENLKQAAIMLEQETVMAIEDQSERWRFSKLARAYQAFGRLLDSIKDEEK